MNSDNGREDNQVLMDALLPKAEQLLEQQGEFTPFGGGMEPDGNIITMGMQEGEEGGSPAEAVPALRNGFARDAKAGKFKATALVYCARVPVPGSNAEADVLTFELDHLGGDSIMVFLPFRFQDDELQYGQVFAQEGDRKIFS